MKKGRMAGMTALVLGLALAAAPACREWFEEEPPLSPRPEPRFVHHVEVIYQRPQVLCPHCGDSLHLCMDVWRPDKGYVMDCHFYDERREFCCPSGGDCKCDVERIGPDTYRAYFDDVYVQRPGEPRHQAWVGDDRGWGPGCETVGHGITVRGAVDAEVKTRTWPGCGVGTVLLFRMSEE